MLPLHCFREYEASTIEAYTALTPALSLTPLANLSNPRNHPEGRNTLWPNHPTFGRQLLRSPGIVGLPFGAVPVRGDVGRHVVSLPGAVHGRVKCVERFEHVERTRIGVKQLTKERRTASLVR